MSFWNFRVTNGPHYCIVYWPYQKDMNIQVQKIPRKQRNIYVEGAMKTYRPERY